MTTGQDLGWIADQAAVRHILDGLAPFDRLTLRLSLGSTAYTLTAWAGGDGDPDMGWMVERSPVCAWCLVATNLTDVPNELCVDCEREDRPADRHHLYGPV